MIFSRKLRNKYYFEYISVSLFIIIYSLIYIATPIIQVRFGHDVIYMMDGANRIINGQIPHNSFSTIVPSLNLYILSLFLYISDFSTQSFFYISLFFSFLVLIWTLYRLKTINNNENKKVILLLFILAFSFCFGLYHTGHSPNSITYANSYNRYGYGLLVILIGELLFEFELLSTVLITSIILFVLFFLKQTYFFAAVIILFFQVQGRSDKIKFFILVFIFTFLFSLFYILFTGINPLLLFRDYILPILVKNKTDLRAKFFNKELLVNLIPLFLASLVILKYYRTLLSIKYAKLLILTIFFSLFFHLTNYSFTEIPFLNIVSIVVLYILINAKVSITPRNIFITSLPILCFFSVNTFSIGFSLFKKYNTKIIKFDAYKLRDLYIEKADGYINSNYVQDINDGSKILKKHLNPNNTFTNLYFENPFTLTNNTNILNHQPLLWQYGMTYSDLHFPNEKIFYNTDFIILKKPLEEELDQRKVYKIYNIFINNNYKQIDSSKRWILLKKCY